MQIATYDTLVSAPRNAVTVKRAATLAIQTGLRNCKQILEKRLDGFVNAKKSAEPDFYNAYKASRVIVDNKGKSKKHPEEPVVES